MNASNPACVCVSVTIALLQLGQVIVQERGPKTGTPTITGIVCGSGCIVEGFAKKSYNSLKWRQKYDLSSILI